MFNSASQAPYWHDATNAPRLLPAVEQGARHMYYRASAELPYTDVENVRFLVVIANEIKFLVN